MDKDIVTVYCLVDETVKALGIADDVRSRITNAEVLTWAYMAMVDFRGNYKRAYRYGYSMRLFAPIEYSRLMRRINSLSFVMERLFVVFGKWFTTLHNLAVYAIDSAPVEICQITREKRCRLWQDVKLKGYNASKKRFFYGFKLHIVATTNKEPVLCSITEGSNHDLEAAFTLLPHLPQGSVTLGDKGYVSKELETQLKSQNIIHSPLYRSNARIKDKELFIKKRLRKSIETLFSTLTERFGKVIKATSIHGFITKLKMHLLAYQLECVVKCDYAKQKTIFGMVGACLK